MANDIKVDRLAIFLIAALVLYSCGDWKHYDKRQLDSFPALEVLRIRAQNDAGDIRIELGDGDTITVDQEMRASGYDLTQQESERAFRQARVVGRMTADGTLLLETRDEPASTLDQSDWLIRSPRPVSAECSSATGDVKAFFMGSARLDAPRGSVEAEHLSGNVSGTAGGTLSLTGIAGNIAIQSEGDAMLDDVHGHVDLSVSNGSADVRVAPPFGATVRIFAGESIVLGIPAAFAARYQVEATGGTITYSGIDLRDIQSEAGGSKLSGVTGGGQGQVLLRTAGGGIDIKGN